VRDGRARQLAGTFARRNLGPSISAQCTNAEIAQASSLRQHRSTAVCRALPLLPQTAGGAENPQAGDRQRRYGLGPAAGVSFEYMLTPSWSIKTGGVFTSLGTQTVNVTSPTAAALGYPLGFNETVNTDMLCVKGGISYHLNFGS
jgi:hypothetical protein